MEEHRQLIRMGQEVEGGMVVIHILVRVRLEEQDIVEVVRGYVYTSSTASNYPSGCL